MRVCFFCSFRFTISVVLVYRAATYPLRGKYTGIKKMAVEIGVIILKCNTLTRPGNLAIPADDFIPALWENTMECLSNKIQSIEAAHFYVHLEDVTLFLLK